MSAGVTIPQALLRSAADDRDEAERHCFCGAYGEQHECGADLCRCSPFARCGNPDYDAALAAVLASQAEAVQATTLPDVLCSETSYATEALFKAAKGAQTAANLACHNNRTYTISQRADVLQAARLLCKVALEVGGGA